MIDQASGTLFFDDGTEVDPRILRPAFLASPLEKPTAPDAQSAPPWEIYTLAPRLLDGAPYASRLSFHGDGLRLLAIWNTALDEAHRMHAHETWLLKTIGETAKVFDWGKVDAVTEPGGTNIVLFSYL
ncbi:MAG TPA: hypothetical protein VF407_20950 [Polyangiaceae bacterium]